MKKDQMMEQFREALRMFVASLDDEKAMEVAAVYGAWKPNKVYNIGDRFTYGENGVGDPQLYKVNQHHTASEIYPPGSTGTAALYTPIGLDEDGYPVWAAPTGAHDSYAVGDIVDYNGVLYISKIPGNTTVPGTDARYWEVYTP